MNAGNSTRTRTSGFTLVAMFVAVLLAACSREQPADDPVPPAPAPDTQVAAPEPAPEPEPEAETDASDLAALDGSPAGTSGVTGFHGFGPARFGDDEESVRIAWGRPLAWDQAAESGAGCAWLRPDPAPSDEFRIAFLFDDGQLVRYDVAGAGYEAPGGGRVGNTREALESLYRDRVEPLSADQPEGGRHLRIAGPDGAATVLVFDLDAGGIARQWRIGLPSALADTEGCP